MIFKKMKRVFLYSTVEQKFLVGLTGIALSIFILVHMLGNLYLFSSPQDYNMYSHRLINNPFILVFEIFLAGFFIIHIIWALALTYLNKQKKGFVGSPDKTASIIHKTLWAQGLVILIFVILHLITFKYGTYYTVQYDDVKVRDLFRLVAEIFQKPSYVIWYLTCLIILFFHLAHGLKASIQSLGFYSPWIQNFSWIYSFIVITGFSCQPIYFFLFYKGAIIGS